MISTIASVIGPITSAQTQFTLIYSTQKPFNNNYSTNSDPYNHSNITNDNNEFVDKDYQSNATTFQDDLYNTSIYEDQAMANFTKSIELDNAFNLTNISAADGDPQIPAYIRTTSMVFCIIIMCLGVVGNVMVPIVIMKTKDMRNSTNIFLMNLSIADLMVLLVCTPTVLVEVNTKPETWVLGKEMCLAVPFVELTVAHASVLTILAISFERYYAICEPLKAGYVCTKTRAALICFLAWFVAAVFTSPILGFATYNDHAEYIDGSIVSVCLTQADTFWSATFFVTTITIFFILPLAILIILYTIIANNLMENPGIINQNNKHHNVAGSHLRYRKQVVMMLGTVVLSFFVCLLPFRAFTLWIVIVSQEDVESLGVEAYFSILYFCRIMLYLNSAVNPILYNLMSSKFRDGFLKLLRLYKFKKLQRYHKGDQIQRKDTFNTTTSTNYSSSQHTSDSFWRRYSNRNSSQKSPQTVANGIARNISQKSKEQEKKQLSKVSEIVNVQNIRRNSMRFISDIILVPQDDGVINQNKNQVLQNYLQKSYDEISKHNDAPNDSCSESGDAIDNTGDSTQLNDEVSDNRVQVYTKDAIVIEGLSSSDKKSRLIKVPVLISRNSSTTITKHCITSQFSKESFV